MLNEISVLGTLNSKQQRLKGIVIGSLVILQVSFLGLLLVYTVLFLFSGTSAKHHVSLNTRSRKKYTDNEANLTNNTKYSTKAVVYPFEVLFAHVRFIMVMSNN